MASIMDELDIAVRNLVAISLLFAATLVVGKKLVSQLNFFDFIVGITIGSIAAALSVDNHISYSHGVISLIIWGLTALVTAKVAIGNLRVRRIVDGVPSIFVQNGKILEDNLSRANYHINDLLEELRLKGVFDISDVESAILETSGQVSVQLKADKQPVTLADLRLPFTSHGLCANLIIDGAILYEHLRLVQRDEIWLLNELKAKNIASPQEVMLASLGSDGNLYVDVKQDRVESLNFLK